MQLAAAGQVGAMQSGSHTKGNWSLAQDVCVSALELSELLEALKTRQRSLVAFAAGFKYDLMRSGIILVFCEHHEYPPCTSHISPSFEAEVINDDSLKSAHSRYLNIMLGTWFNSNTFWNQLKEAIHF
jgi:hypothetical protein